MIRPPPRSTRTVTLFPDTTRFRSVIRTNWSGFKAFSEQAGFGWRDHTTFKLGVAYGLMPGLTVRAGTSLAKRHFGSEFVLANVNTPGTSSKSLTFGFTKRLGEKDELTFRAEYELNGKVVGAGDRQSVGEGKRGAVRGDLGGGRIIK